MNLFTLPPELVCGILSLLPLASRLHCRAVSRGWKAFLDEELRLWQRIALNSDCGARPTLPLLRAAAARSHGQLLELDVRGSLTAEEVTAWLELESADSKLLHLKRLLTAFELGAATVERLLAAAPSLTELRCSVTCSPSEAVRLLKGPSPLRFDSLSVSTHLDTLAMDAAALGAAIGGNAWVERLRLSHARLGNKVVLETFTARLRGVRELTLMECGLQPASLPALTQLLTDGKLCSLTLSGEGGELIRGPGAVAFRDAILRSQLRVLELTNLSLFSTLASGLATLAVCTDHPTLRVLGLSANKAIDGCADEAVGRALGAMVETLESLSIVDCAFGDEGMGPLFDALRRPLSRLSTLDASFSCLSRQCSRRTVLPAVRANASLRRLSFGYTMDESLQEATAIVAARA